MYFPRVSIVPLFDPSRTRNDITILFNVSNITKFIRADYYYRLTTYNYFTINTGQYAQVVTCDATIPSNNPLNPDLRLVSITIRSILFFSNILLRKRFLFHIYSNIFKKDILLQSYHGKCEYKYRVHFQGCGRT